MVFQWCENVFDLYPEMMVHPVNCTGLARDGYSKQLKKAWPDYFREYTRACLRKHLKPGKPVVHENSSLFGTRFIVTLPVKEHWNGVLLPDVVRTAFHALIDQCVTLKVTTLAIPELKGPPKDWMEKELTKQFAQTPSHCVETIYFFASESEG